MASLPLAKFPQQFAPAIAAPKPTPQISLVPARLSPLEWSVVALAERDTLSSLREPGRLAAALHALFGLSRQNPLANPRLEALRRMAVLVWHHRWSVPKSEVRAFCQAGFSLDHYELIQASIGKARPSRRGAGR